MEFNDILFLSLDWLTFGYLMDVLEYQVFFSVSNFTNMVMLCQHVRNRRA